MDATMLPMTVPVRPSREDEGPLLRQIERLAGERFRQVGLDSVADDEPATVEELAAYARVGRSWVAVDDGGQPLGYVIVDVVDGQAHIEQISVRPDRQRSGIGQALIDQVRRWARETGRSAITLTTFTDVPWNRPWYERLGFVVLRDHQIGPDLQAVRDAEARHGLNPEERVCMRLDLEG
jgi:ribosomal protein S18 acetylase RimI-like enzyme